MSSVAFVSRAISRVRDSMWIHIWAFGWFVVPVCVCSELISFCLHGGYHCIHFLLPLISFSVSYLLTIACCPRAFMHKWRGIWLHVDWIAGGFLIFHVTKAYLFIHALTSVDVTRRSISQDRNTTWLREELCYSWVVQWDCSHVYPHFIMSD